jgi:hypothetical protein
MIMEMLKQLNITNKKIEELNQTIQWLNGIRPCPIEPEPLVLKGNQSETVAKGIAEVIKSEGVLTSMQPHEAAEAVKNMWK